MTSIGPGSPGILGGARSIRRSPGAVGSHRGHQKNSPSLSMSFRGLPPLQQLADYGQESSDDEFESQHGHTGTPRGRPRGVHSGAVVSEEDDDMTGVDDEMVAQDAKGLGRAPDPSRANGEDACDGRDTPKFLEAAGSTRAQLQLQPSHSRNQQQQFQSTQQRLKDSYQHNGGAVVMVHDEDFEFGGGDSHQSTRPSTGLLDVVASTTSPVVQAVFLVRLYRRLTAKTRVVSVSFVTLTFQCSMNSLCVVRIIALNRTPIPRFSQPRSDNTRTTIPTTPRSPRLHLGKCVSTAIATTSTPALSGQLHPPHPIPRPFTAV